LAVLCSSAREKRSDVIPMIVSACHHKVCWGLFL